MSELQEIDEIVSLGEPSAHSTMPPAAYARAPVAPQPAAVQQPAPHNTHAQPGNKPKGVAGILVALGVVLAKWWAVALGLLLKLKGFLFAAKFLFAGKLLLTGGTMFLSMFLWSYQFGWPMAVGLVLSIFIHECGHALAAKKLGHKLGIMVFLPFMGAFVTSRGGRNVTEGAFVGIMGPVAGTLTAVACVGVYTLTRSPFWLALAMIGFFMNLFNLVPSRPLDGGWIAPLISPKLLLPGMVVALILFHSNPFVWLLVIMGVPSTIHAWRHGHVTEYYKASSQDRWTYGLAYLGLILFLGASLFATTDYMRSHFVRKTSHPRQAGNVRSVIG